MVLAGYPQIPAVGTTPHMIVRCAPLLLLAACTSLKHSIVEPEVRPRGPLPTRVQHPMKLNVLAFRPRQPEALEAGRHRIEAQSAYTSIFENGTGVGERVVLDGELWTNHLSWRHGLGASTDIEVELGLMYASSGFLDGFIEGWHYLFALPGGGYYERPRFAYEMSVEKNGNEAYALESDTMGLLDLPVIVTHELREAVDERIGLALRAGIELPTGSESRGFGNGRVDWGLAVSAGQSFGRWSWTLGLDWVEAGRSERFANSGVEYAADWGAHLGAEYRWNAQLSILSALNFDSRLSHDIEIKELDNPMLMLDLGVAFDAPGGSRWHLGFSEDLIAESGPDFGVFLGWSAGF